MTTSARRWWRSHTHLQRPVTCSFLSISERERENQRRSQRRERDSFIIPLSFIVKFSGWGILTGSWGLLFWWPWNKNSHWAAPQSFSFQGETPALSGFYIKHNTSIDVASESSVNAAAIVTRPCMKNVSWEAKSGENGGLNEWANLSAERKQQMSVCFRFNIICECVSVCGGAWWSCTHSQLLTHLHAASDWLCMCWSFYP